MFILSKLKAAATFYWNGIVYILHIYLHIYYGRMTRLGDDTKYRRDEKKINFHLPESRERFSGLWGGNGIEFIRCILRPRKLPGDTKINCWLDRAPSNSLATMGEYCGVCDLNHKTRIKILDCFCSCSVTDGNMRERREENPNLDVASYISDMYISFFFSLSLSLSFSLSFSFSIHSVSLSCRLCFSYHIMLLNSRNWARNS